MIDHEAIINRLWSDHNLLRSLSGRENQSWYDTHNRHECAAAALKEIINWVHAQQEIDNDRPTED